ncbi:hypothetical protein H4582DRAFT_366687 [Lactarius indigo]|nr:hypothetical protein H4582DRAFT_366687 [Lactarius indigo]
MERFHTFDSQIFSFSTIEHPHANPNLNPNPAVSLPTVGSSNYTASPAPPLVAPPPIVSSMTDQYRSDMSPVSPEAVHTLAGTLGRGRQRTDYTIEGGTERSRSPAATSFSSPYDDRLFELPEFVPSESPYALNLPISSSRIGEDSTPSRASIPSLRVQRDGPISRLPPWRSPLPPNDTSEDRIPTHLSPMRRGPPTVPPGEDVEPGEWCDFSRAAFYAVTVWP